MVKHKTAVKTFRTQTDYSYEEKNCSETQREKDTIS